MIRSLVKRGIKRVLHMETRPAEYGGPTTAYAPPPEPPMPPAPVVPEAPPPQPEAVVAAPEPAKKPKKQRTKKPKVEERPTLGEELRMILDPLGLAWKAEGGFLMVTSKESLDAAMSSGEKSGMDETFAQLDELLAGLGASVGRD